jgi:hypothetical protein
MLKVDLSLYYTLKSFLYKYLFRDLKVVLSGLYKHFKVLPQFNILFLPIAIKKFSVVRSPTTSKLSKEQFEIRTYKLSVSFSSLNPFNQSFLFNNLSKFNLKTSYSHIKTYHGKLSC